MPAIFFFETLLVMGHKRPYVLNQSIHRGGNKNIFSAYALMIFI